MEKSEHHGLLELFNLGARLGSLEGYLYGAAKVEKKYLAGWLHNIDREFKELPTEVGRHIAEDYATVLDKVLKLVQGHFGENDVDTLQVKEIVASLKGLNQ